MTDTKLSRLKWISGIYILLVATIWLAIHKYSFNWGTADDFLMADWYRSYFIVKDSGLFDLILAHNAMHPVGAEVVLTLILFRIFGINFLVILFTVFIVLLTSQLFLFLSFKKTIKNRCIYYVLLISILLVQFHPTQIHHLLWPFEIGWLMITGCLSLNIWLVEKLEFDRKALSLIAFCCFTACLCSAQGIFLWLAAAFHLWLKKGWRAQRGWIVAFGLAFVAWAIVIANLTPPGTGRLAISQLLSFLVYVISLIGGTFGVRDLQLIFLLGTILLLFVFIYGLLLWRRPVLSAADRVSSVLIFASLLMMLAFAVGRHQYGLPWVLAQFHAAPLLVPLLIGLIILALATLDGLPEHRWLPWVALLPAVFVFASIVSSLGYAAEQGEQSRTQRALAMHFSCNSGTSGYLREGLNSFPGNIDLLTRIFPLMRHLCGQNLPERARVLAAFPQPFHEMIAANPTYEKPLHDLWEVYITHFDLVRAFWIADPSGARGLLTWARNNARTGSIYEPQMLKQHETFFKDLKVEP